ncbi:MAG TPA: glycosyl hydrolase family 65 protein [Nocardioidaceae bacterium]|nr:glycosyl hydrolase family 65 protein [Nocardioidaceae bacterium]
MSDPAALWRLERGPEELGHLAVTESLFTQANAHIGLRGSLEEGVPRGRPGTYVSGFFEDRPLPHAEAGYGFPESSQTVVSVADGKLIRLIVGDSPFDTRYGTVEHHRRCLDLRTGILSRETVWTSPGGARVEVTSQRLVSFAYRTLAAIHYEVKPLDEDLYLALQSDLLVNEPANGASPDPRDVAVLDQPLVSELFDHDDDHAVLVHRTSRSRRRIAAGMRHLLDVPDGAVSSLSATPDLARLAVAACVPRGVSLRVVKLLGYGWSRHRPAAALRDQIDGALSVAALMGWDGLAQRQQEFLDEFWRVADVNIGGDPQLQQAVRLSTFHVLQAGARTQGEAIPAKGLTGPGYDGHAFWDSEAFVLPVLTYTFPEAAAGALRWRHRTLPLARARAEQLGLGGAAFAWRTINGEECSGYWPAGTAAMHLAAAVADATARYLSATGDAEFETRYGVELLVETARLWMSLGHFCMAGKFRIRGVTGPDEYTALVDDNVYTNLMAQRNLCEAATACRRRTDVAAHLDVAVHEVEAWEAAAEAMYVPFDAELGVHPQSEGFTHDDEWDFKSTGSDDYPLLLHFPYFQLYRKQVVKQADLVLALHFRGDAFTPEQKARDFAYYEARTVRDSSLSAATQAIVAAELGHLQLAHDYWAETAFTDVHNLHGNVSSGLHIAAMAGSWMVAVAGFGGMRDHDGNVTFAPRLPPQLDRLAFRMRLGTSLLEVEVNRLAGPACAEAEGHQTIAAGEQQATYRLLEGDAVHVEHHGGSVDLRPGVPVTLAVPAMAPVAPVSQPPGRGPAPRTSDSNDLISGSA